jgi:hypothetical protein
MKPTAYIETSVVSHLVGKTPNHLVTAGHQQSTRDWWNFRRHEYQLFISLFVVDEIERGDPKLAAERMSIVEDMEMLPVVPSIEELAEKILRATGLPEKARIDVSHIAISAVHRMGYLLTWNMRHIANVFIRERIEKVCASAGLKCPLICTPEHLVRRYE